MTDMNILDLFLKASLLVKLIMLILIGFSIASWAIIIQRTRILNSAAREAEAFEDKFWSGIELSRLYQDALFLHVSGRDCIAFPVHCRSIRT